MKLTIKDASGLNKVVELNNNSEFNITEGQQYIFSNNFSSYTLDLSNNEKSISLVFNVEGKEIKVELNDIVPLLNANTGNTENPTALIINKDLDADKFDNIVENTVFTGSEILDSLEALLSSSVTTENDSVVLVSDFNSLIESLEAAAAGESLGNSSTFNSDFSNSIPSLAGIADSDRWFNPSDSLLSSEPIDVGNDISITDAQNAPVVSIVADETNTLEGTDANFTVSIDTVLDEDVTVTFTIGGDVDGADYVTPTVLTVTIPAGQTEVPLDILTIDDGIYSR